MRSIFSVNFYLKNFRFNLVYFCSEVLCQEALQLTIGNNLLWSTSRDTQEGIQGKYFLYFLL